MIDQIDFCIKAFNRPDCLKRLVESIQRFYPEAAITVNYHDRVDIGRNQMVDKTDRPFLLFLDDDFCFTEATKIERLMEHMTGDTIACGQVMDHLESGIRAPRNSGGTMRIEGTKLILEKRLESGPIDVGPQFFVSPRRLFDVCRWRFGIGPEHPDFFLQVQQAGWKVVQDTSVEIDHFPFDPESRAHCYKQGRWGRYHEHMNSFMRHWKLTEVIQNGQVNFRYSPT